MHIGDAAHYYKALKHHAGRCSGCNCCEVIADDHPRFFGRAMGFCRGVAFAMGLACGRGAGLGCGAMWGLGGGGAALIAEELLLGADAVFEGFLGEL